MRNGRKAKGQSTAEYAVVIAIVLGAVIGMQTFVKRGLQARYKVATDALASVKGANDLASFNSNLPQFEPYYAEQNIVSSRGENYNETYALGKFGKSGAFTNIRRSGTQNEGVNLTADDAWK